MSPETQQKILAVLYRLLDDVAYTLGLETNDYESMIQFVRLGIRAYGTPFSMFALEWAKRIIPGGTDSSVQPEKFDEYLSQVDTKEKAEALLLSLREPDPQWLEATLSAVRAELPRLRQALLPVAKRLPHPPGGRHKLLSDSAKRQEIRDEIKRLRSWDTRLEDLQQRIADREGVSLKTIQRIWREPDQ